VAEVVTENAPVAIEQSAPPAEAITAEPTPAKPDTADVATAEEAKPDETASDKPKRRGWWSIGR